MQAKKGQAVWMSWVLLIFLVVVVGTIAGRYIIDKTGREAETLEKYGMTEEECVNVALSVDFMCKNSKALNMTLSNNGNIRIDKIILKLYDTSGSAENQEQDVNLMPGQVQQLEIPRARSAYEVEIMPAITVENQELECRMKTLTETNIPDCT